MNFSELFQIAVKVAISSAICKYSISRMRRIKNWLKQKCNTCTMSTAQKQRKQF